MVTASSVRIELGNQGQPIARYVCPYCGGELFELVSLGIPGTGSSKCVKCGKPIASWVHEAPRSAAKDLIP